MHSVAAALTSRVSWSLATVVGTATVSRETSSWLAQDPRFHVKRVAYRELLHGQRGKASGRAVRPIRSSALGRVGSSVVSRETAASPPGPRSTVGQDERPLRPLPGGPSVGYFATRSPPFDRSRRTVRAGCDLGPFRRGSTRSMTLLLAAVGATVTALLGTDRGPYLRSDRRNRTSCSSSGSSSRWRSVSRRASSGPS
jgi:hypothetical protein